MNMLYILSCQDGPKGALNESFVAVNPKMKLPYSKLVGTYVLDNDSKQRFKIQDSVQMNLEIKKDTSLFLNNYIAIDNRSLLNKSVKSKLYYINNFNEKSPMLYLGVFNKEITSSGALQLYYRNSDKEITLYVYIKPLKGDEYGDYLRYIKVK